MAANCACVEEALRWSQEDIDAAMEGGGFGDGGRLLSLSSPSSRYVEVYGSILLGWLVYRQSIIELHFVVSGFGILFYLIIPVAGIVMRMTK